MFAVAGQRRFAPWLVASALAHALGAAGFVLLRPLTTEPLAPLRVVRVDLVAAPAPGPPAASPEPVVSPAALAPAPHAPAPPRPKPTPRAQPKPVAKPAPAPSAPPVPTPSAAEVAPPGAEAGEPARAEAGEAARAEAGEAALAAVGAGPPSGGGPEAGTSAAGGDALAAYIAGLQRAIDAHKSYPAMARRRGIEGIVRVRLAIDALGTLETTALVGRPPEILARSTLEAVARAGPFPPPPGGRLQVEFPVRYEIVD